MSLRKNIDLRRTILAAFLAASVAARLGAQVSSRVHRLGLLGHAVCVAGHVTGK
jgi:hypothetical protein